MKSYTMYVCETCGFECDDGEMMMEHEASHLGLSIEEFEQYNALKSRVRFAAGTLYHLKNHDSKKKYDKVLEQLVAFEKEHNIKE